MDIEIIRGFCWGDGRDVMPGDVMRGVELEKAVALIRTGKAREVIVRETSEIIEIRDPEPEHRDPVKPKKRR